MNLLDLARTIASDRDAGAAELLSRLLPVLADAIRAGGETPLHVSRIVLQGQPGMAPLWHACAAALGDLEAPGSFTRARAEFERAPRTLVRAASAALGDLFAGDRDPLVLTLSYSSSVCDTLSIVAATRRLRVVCGEGRPRYEGRRFAGALHQAGAEVTLVVDAAVTALLDGAAAVVLGADAVGAGTWINKVGSFGLVAAAASTGVPIYVVAGRHKFTPAALEPRLVLPDGPAAEVWEAPGGIAVRNPYFERVPAELVTLFLTDVGRLTPADLSQAVARQRLALDELIQYMSHSSS